MNNSRSGLLVVLTMALLFSGSPSEAGDAPGDVVDGYFSAYRDGSLERMLASFSSDAVFEDVAQRHRFQGTEQISQLFGSLLAMHHSMGLKEKRRVIHGNTVVVEFDYVGKLNGAVLGQSVGKDACPDLEYVLPATSWYEIENGKIARQRDFIDLATYQELRQQLLAAGN